MRDFQNYTSSQKKNGATQDNVSLIKELAKKYEGASEGELIAAIMQEAEKGKRNGTLTNSDIDNFQNVLMPMLNANQKAILKNVVNKIKNG